jgi:hypothetical protein
VDRERRVPGGKERGMAEVLKLANEVKRCQNGPVLINTSIWWATASRSCLQRPKIRRRKFFVHYVLSPQFSTRCPDQNFQYKEQRTQPQVQTSIAFPPHAILLQIQGCAQFYNSILREAFFGNAIPELLPIQPYGPPSS